MAEASIPLDIFNPGQVFACIGLVEAAEILLGKAEGVFDWGDPGDIRFHVRANGEDAPVERVLRFLDQAEAKAVAPAGSKSLSGWTDSWGAPPKVLDREKGYPFPDPSSPATLVCILSNGDHEITLDYWGDETRRDNVKFWAGAGGYPGAALARDALALVRGQAAKAFQNPFEFSTPQSSSFRLDWRRDYIPIDSGFSLNAHGNIETMGFPLVEILAAIGLRYARPRRPDWRDKLVYHYGVVGRSERSDRTWMPLPLLRATLGGGQWPYPTRFFRMSLNWPGQEGQARAITTVVEESGI